MTLQNKKGVTTISKEYPGRYDKDDKIFDTPFIQSMMIRTKRCLINI